MTRRKKKDDRSSHGYGKAIVLLLSLGVSLQNAWTIARPRPMRDVQVFMMSDHEMPSTSEASAGLLADPFWHPFDFEKDDQHFEDVFWHQTAYDQKNDPLLQVGLIADRAEDPSDPSPSPSGQLLEHQKWSAEQQAAYAELLAAQTDYAHLEKQWSDGLKQNNQLMAMPFLEAQPDDDFVEVPVELLDPNWTGLQDVTPSDFGEAATPTPSASAQSPQGDTMLTVGSVSDIEDIDSEALSMLSAPSSTLPRSSISMGEAPSYVGDSPNIWIDGSANMEDDADEELEYTAELVEEDNVCPIVPIGATVTVQTTELDHDYTAFQSLGNVQMLRRPNSSTSQPVIPRTSHAPRSAMSAGQLPISTYRLPDSPSTLAGPISPQSRYDAAQEDDEWLATMNVRCSAAQLGSLSSAQYLDILRRSDIDERQRECMRIVRRRWKNRIAARNSRRRRALDS